MSVVDFPLRVKLMCNDCGADLESGGETWWSGLQVDLRVKPCRNCERIKKEVEEYERTKK